MVVSALFSQRFDPPFCAEMLVCALTLTGKLTPSSAELAAALEEMYPGNAGPTVADVLAGGWLVPTIDGHGLRLPPPPADYLWQQVDSSSEQALAKKFDPSNDASNAGSLLIPEFSYFRGGIATTTPCASITPAELHSILTSHQNRARTEALRAAPVGSPYRAELKKGLDYVTPAGTFKRRANAEIVAASGLLVLDFDHVPNLALARAALLNDKLMAPELVLLFTSPSGDGLKAIVQTSSASHQDTFLAYSNYLAGKYTPLGLVPDKAGKDLARACFVPYAPDAWLAPSYAAA